MRGLFLACFGALSTAAFACDGISVSIPTRDHGTATAWSGSRVAPEARLNDEALAEVIGEVQACRALHADWQIVKYAIFSTEQDQNEFLHPPKGTHFSFNAWKAAYDRINPKAQALVLVLGNSVVARKVGSTGTQEVIFGKLSPEGHFEPDTHLGGGDLAGIQISDVLDIRVQKHLDGIPGTPFGSVTLYAKAGEPVRHTPIETFGRSLVSLLGEVAFPNVSVVISNDTWFINDREFPIRYPFQPKKPTPHVTPDSTAVICTRNEINFSCDLVP